MYAIVCGYMALVLTRPTRMPFTHFPRSSDWTSNQSSSPVAAMALCCAGGCCQPPAGRASADRSSWSTARAPTVRLGQATATWPSRRHSCALATPCSSSTCAARRVGRRAIHPGRARSARRRRCARLSSSAWPGQRRVSLVGFSMGGATALLTAIDEPAVRRGRRGFGLRRPGRPDRGRGAQGERPTAVLYARDGARRAGLDRRGPVRHPAVDGMPHLAAAGVPVLFVHGETDTYVPLVNAPAPGDQLRPARRDAVRARRRATSRAT